VDACTQWAIGWASVGIGRWVNTRGAFLALLAVFYCVLSYEAKDKKLKQGELEFLHFWSRRVYNVIMKHYFSNLPPFVCDVGRTVTTVLTSYVISYNVIRNTVIASSFPDKAHVGSRCVTCASCY
jgi:hypothetical protein